MAVGGSGVALGAAAGEIVAVSGTAVAIPVGGAAVGAVVARAAVAVTVAIAVAVGVAAGRGVPSSRGEASRVTVGVGTGVCGPLSAPAAPPASGSGDSTPASGAPAGGRLQVETPIRATSSWATRNQPTRMVNQIPPQDWANHSTESGGLLGQWDGGR